MHLEISTKLGLIGIKTTPGELNIEKTQARLEVKQEVGRISIKTEKPKLKISQYEPMAQMGYKKASDAAVELAQIGKQKALEYIAAKAEEGRRLQTIEKGGNPIREIAIEKAWRKKERQGGFTPFARVSYDSEPAKITITPPEVKNAAHTGYEAEFIPGAIKINYRRGQVSIYMRQYPEVKIDIIL
ncbi:MAG: hypothetical protein GXY12_07630 [Clostridiaceae bacterium]|nr:hypothetical protein [Clostridiaceae bacterium]